MSTVPNIVQYQGSKRLLAPQILRYMPQRFARLVEPFAGMASMTFAAAAENRCGAFWVNDLNAPLLGIVRMAAEQPQQLLAAYRHVWQAQFSWPDGHVAHFYHVRERFNVGEKTPEHMLYLIARCVKGAVRYGRDGQFNQSPDKRRHGTRPEKLEHNLRTIAALLGGRAQFSALDYREVLATCRSGDVVYMDPPYQGVSGTRDHRYLAGVEFDEFAAALETLNRRGVDFLVSYDGACGEKSYGRELPDVLDCRKVLLRAGLSTQALLLGKKEITREALYISRNLQHNLAMPLHLPPAQAELFGAAA
ncbi:MAG: DNA adenine methylase [Rhodocyclaceae bacterium]|nr:DNA adenine methylase [Rhodocyclaceae bacterium]